MGKIGDEILNRLKNEKSELQQIDERLNTISTKTVSVKNNYSKATREELISERNTLYVNIKAKNMLDYNFENISLALYSLEEA